MANQANGASIKAVKRIFVFKEENLPDPNPSFKVNEVLDFYSTKYPELTTATVGEPTVDDNGDMVYDINYSVGDKA